MSASTKLLLALVLLTDNTVAFLARDCCWCQRPRSSLPLNHNKNELAQTIPAANESWFCKTEQFKRPFPEVKPHLEAHKEWVTKLRTEQGMCITSGYRVDAAGRPGGGGLMFLAAQSYEAALEVVLQDPLVANDCVDWELNGWIGQVGDIQMR